MFTIRIYGRADCPENERIPRLFEFTTTPREHRRTNVRYSGRGYGFNLYGLDGRIYGIVRFLTTAATREGDTR